MIQPKILIQNFKLESTALFYFEYIKSNSTITQPKKCMFNFNSRTTRKGREIISKLSTKSPRQRRWGRSGVFVVNFEHILHTFLLFLLLTLYK